jgi:hypothetical protein
LKRFEKAVFFITLRSAGMEYGKEISLLRKSVMLPGVG